MRSCRVAPEPSDLSFLRLRPGSLQSVARRRRAMPTVVGCSSGREAAPAHSFFAPRHRPNAAYPLGALHSSAGHCACARPTPAAHSEA
jgi:hypothetical protein